MNIMKDITKMTRKMDSESGNEIMDRSTLVSGRIIQNLDMELIMTEKDCTTKELGRMI